MPIAIDAPNQPWEQRTITPTGDPVFRKNLYTDPDTGMEVRLVRYPAGVINVSHTHPCAHGMYVLEGTLVTHAGRFGSGCFVWFPEGGLRVGSFSCSRQASHTVGFPALSHFSHRKFPHRAHVAARAA